MTDPLTLAKRAKSFIEDEMVSGLLADIEAQYLSEFRKSGDADSAVREFVYWKLKALDDLRGQFQRVIDNGAMFDKRGR